MIHTEKEKRTKRKKQCGVERLEETKTQIEKDRNRRRKIDGLKQRRMEKRWRKSKRDKEMRVTGRERE